MKKFKLEIVTPDGVCYDGEAESLLVRTTDGDVEILNGHTDYIAALGIGRARILNGTEAKYASVSGGFITVTKAGVRLAAVTFEFAEDIDLERARRAEEEAQRRLREARDTVATELAKAKLARALSRINVAGIK